MCVYLLGFFFTSYSRQTIYFLEGLAQLLLSDFYPLLSKMCSESHLSLFAQELQTDSLPSRKSVSCFEMSL